MEAVSLHALLFVGARQSQAAGDRIHCPVTRGIKACDLRNARLQSRADTNPCQVMRLVATLPQSAWQQCAHLRGDRKLKSLPFRHQDSAIARPDCVAEVVGFEVRRETGKG